MTVWQWSQLVELCDLALEEASPEQREHPTFKSVALTRAFAAAVVHHMSEGN